MDNKKIPTSIGAIILVIIAITAGMFVWVYEKGQNWGVVTMQPQIVQKNSGAEKMTNEPISEWKTYQDKKYGFEFKYPKAFDVKITDYYSISDSSKEKVRFSIKKWKDYIIQENTPGTFWEKVSYAEWKYFSDNFQNIPSGKCSDETLTHISGLTVADIPKLCTISRQNNFLKVETENRIIYFTKDIEIRWELTQDNKDLVHEIASTLILK